MVTFNPSNCLSECLLKGILCSFVVSSPIARSLVNPPPHLSVSLPLYCLIATISVSVLPTRHCLSVCSLCLQCIANQSMSQCIDCSSLSHISVVYQSLSKELFTCDGFNFCFAHSPLSQFLFCLIVIVAVSVLIILVVIVSVSVLPIRRCLSVRFTCFTYLSLSQSVLPVLPNRRCLSVCFTYSLLSQCLFYLFYLLIAVSVSVLPTRRCLSVCFTCFNYLSLSQCLFYLFYLLVTVSVSVLSTRRCLSVCFAYLSPFRIHVCWFTRQSMCQCVGCQCQTQRTCGTHTSKTY